MAKTKEKAESKTETKKVFTVADLAEELGCEPHEARARLRKAGIEKEEGKYQWTGQKAFDSVVKKTKTSAEAKESPRNKAEAAPETKAKKVRPAPNK